MRVIGGANRLSNRNLLDKNIKATSIDANSKILEVDLLHFWTDETLDFDAPTNPLQGIDYFENMLIAIFDRQENIGDLPISYALKKAVYVEADSIFKLETVNIDHNTIIIVKSGWFNGTVLIFQYYPNVSTDYWHYRTIFSQLTDFIPYDSSNTSAIDSDKIKFFKNILAYNSIELKNANPTDSQITLKAPQVTGDTYSIVLPKDEPTSNKYLKFDGTDYVWDSAGGISVSNPYSAIATNSSGTDIVESTNVQIDNPTVFNSVTTPLYIKNTDPQDTGILIDSSDNGGTSLYIFASDTSEDMEALSIYGIRNIATAPLQLIYGAHTNIAPLFRADSYDSAVYTEIGSDASIMNTGFTANTLLYADTDKKIKSVSGSSIPRHIEVTLTSLQLLNCYTTPIELIPATTGKSIVIDNIFYKMSAGTNYILTDYDVGIVWDVIGGGIPLMIDNFITYAMENHDYDNYTHQNTTLQNNSRVLYQDTGVLFAGLNANPTTGNKTLGIYIEYHLIDY